MNVVRTLAVNDQKAGMKGLDKDQINRIIHEASRGTNYFEHQLRRQERIDKRAKEMERSLEEIDELHRRTARQEMDSLAEELEINRDLTKFIVHVDMDAFFAAVEIRDDPERLSDRPVAVGGASMLSTSNYQARKFGVRAAMPGFIARKLCPDLVIVPPNFDKYVSVSKEVSSILRSYTQDISMMSLDEAYLDITERVRLRELEGEADQVAETIVQEMRLEIFEKTGLTASAGIAPNAMLAKVCSDMNKPNGQFYLPRDAQSVREFVSGLPVTKISGIGPVQGQVFANLGITSCRDLWDKRDVLPLLFTPTAFRFYMRACMGLGSTCIQRGEGGIQKSIGTEESFREIQTRERLHEKCEELCHDLAEELQQREIVGQVVVLKIKNVKFQVTTRNISLGFHTSDKEVIFGAAKKLLDREIAASQPSPLRLRLMGVRMQSLASSRENARQSLLPFQKAKEDLSQCPICGRSLPGEYDLVETNNHIDSCLSRRTIKEMLSTAHTSKRKENQRSPKSSGTKKKPKTTGKSIESYFRVAT